MAELASPFTEACERCGTFAPLTRSFETALCAECVRKSVHEIARTPLDFGHVVKGVGQILLRVGLPAALIGTGLELPHAITAQLVDVPTALDLAWSTLTSLVADLVAIHLAWQVVRGRRSIDVRAAFAAAGEAFPRVFVTRLVAGFQIILMSLLLIVPGVWRALTLFVATPVSMMENKGSADALSRSARLMQGHRWLALASGALSIAPLVGVFAFTSAIAIAMLLVDPTSPPASERWLAFAGDVLSPIAILPATFVPVVFYAKLCPPAPDLR